MTAGRERRILSETNDSFKARALCKDVSPKVFFPYGSGYHPPLPKHDPDKSPLIQAEHLVAQAAIAICDRCPVRVPCLEYALSIHEEEGIWGGTTPTDRRLMVRVRRVRR